MEIKRIAPHPPPFHNTLCFSAWTMVFSVYAFASLNLDHCTGQSSLAARAFKIARFKALFLAASPLCVNLAMPVALLGGWRMADGAGGASPSRVAVGARCVGSITQIDHIK